MQDAEDEDEEPDMEGEAGPSVPLQDVHNEDTIIPDAHHQLDEPNATHPDIEDTDIGSPSHQELISQQQTEQPPADILILEDVGPNGPALAPPVELAPAPELIPLPKVGSTTSLNDESFGDAPSTSKHQRKNSDSDPPSDPDVIKSPSRKRKLVSRESNFANDSQIHHEEVSKRVRDEEGLPKPVQEVPKTIPEAKEDEEDKTDPPPKANPEPAPVSASPPKPVSDNLVRNHRI